MQRVEFETLVACADQIEAIFPAATEMGKIHQLGEGESYFLVRVTVSEHDVFRGLARVCRALTST